MFLDKIPLVSPDYSRPANSLRSRIAVELEPFLSAKALLTTFALVLTPALCVWMYLGGVWDPYGNLAQLPAAVVNQDVPVVQAGRQINLGGDILATLEKEKPFTFVRYPTPDAARAAVQSGKAFFALLIPPDFSQRSVAAESPAQLGLYVSTAGNSTVSLLGQRFGSDLAHSLNEQLNRERWTTWAGETGRGAVSTLGSGLVALQTGSKQLVAHTRRVHAGSAELRQGLLKSVHDAQDLRENADQVVDKSLPVIEGLKEASVAIASLRETLPDKSQLAALAPLSESVVHTSADLKQSLEQVKPDMVQLGAGVTQLQTSTARVIFVGSRLSAEAARVHSGVIALGAAIEKGSEQAGQLNDSATQLNAAIPPLVHGVTGVEKGFMLLDQKLPAPDQLDGFNHAVARLHDSNGTVKVGLDGVSQRIAILDDSNGALEKRGGGTIRWPGGGSLAIPDRFEWQPCGAARGTGGNHGGGRGDITPQRTRARALFCRDFSLGGSGAAEFYFPAAAAARRQPACMAVDALVRESRAAVRARRVAGDRGDHGVSHDGPRPCESAGGVGGRGHRVGHICERDDAPHALTG